MCVTYINFIFIFIIWHNIALLRYLTTQLSLLIIIDAWI